MTKILTDKKLIDKFLTRGVEAIYPSREKLRKKLMSGERLRIYQGFDPTGPFLHIGHAMGIRALRILQQLGHEVIFLVGDYTAKVGDPDKDKTRQILSDKIIECNMAGWKKQAAQLIDFSGENKVKFGRNYKWLSKLKLEELIQLMSRITVQKMLQRDLFKRRIKAGHEIFLHEFIYPLMQGYDSVAMKVDLEIGGTDQIFNMLVGRDLCKAILNKEKFVRANKMMNAPDGRTMSKTKGNGINLSDSPAEMYGKAMSYPDHEVILGLELLTELPMVNIKEIDREIKNGANPMQFKKLMAFEIIRIIKGEKEARQAQEYFERTIQKKETPKEVKVQKLKIINWPLADLLVEVGLAGSKGEAKRLITQGGIKIDGETNKDINKKVKISKTGLILQRGKRQYVKVEPSDL